MNLKSPVQAKASDIKPVNMKEPIRAEINLSAGPILPGSNYWYENAGTERDRGMKTIELRNDELWIDGRRLIFVKDEGQVERNISAGFRILKTLKGRAIQPASLGDFLLQHPEFFPESWKVDENGKPKNIYFWATIFSVPPTPLPGYILVLTCWFENGEWQKFYTPLKSRWHDASYSLVLE